MARIRQTTARLSCFRTRPATRQFPFVHAFLSSEIWLLTGRQRPCGYESVTLPRILLVVPGLLAGLLIQALAHAPKHIPAVNVGTGNKGFAGSVVTLTRGVP